MQAAARVGRHRLLDTVHQQAPVGQPGQRVVESQVLDLCAGLAQLRHVVVRDHQAAIGRGPLGDLDDTPIGQALLVRPLGVALHCHTLLHPALLLFVAGVFQVVPGFLFQQFLERNLGRQLPLEPRVNLFKAAVPLHKAKLAVEHHKAADHGFQRLVQRGLGLRNRQTGLGHAVDVAQRDSPHHHDHHDETQRRQHDAIARGAPLRQRGLQRHAGGNAQVLVHQRAVHHQGLLSAQTRTGIPLGPGHIQLGQRRGEHPGQCLFLPRHGQKHLTRGTLQRDLQPGNVHALNQNISQRTHGHFSHCQQWRSIGQPKLPGQIEHTLRAHKAHSWRAHHQHRQRLLKHRFGKPQRQRHSHRSTCGV